jgi:hypothetical protein
MLRWVRLSDGMDSPVFARDIGARVFMGVGNSFINVRSPT